MRSMQRVSDIMTRDVIHSITSEVSVENAAKRMKDVQRGCLIVIEKGKPIGIITERDLVQKVIAQRAEPSITKVSEIMSSPIVSIGPEAYVSDAAVVMAKNKIRRLPVIEGSELVGIITVSDFAKCLLGESGSDPMLAAMARADQLLWQAIEKG